MDDFMRWMMIDGDRVGRRACPPHRAAIAIFFMSLGCFAGELPAGVVVAVESACPEAPDTYSYAVGDLNGDKMPDTAIVLGCKSHEDQEIIVLLGQKDGLYKISHRTQVWSRESRREIEIGITKEVIVFLEHCAYNCLPESWSSKYKFRLLHDQFILIGEESLRTKVRENLQDEDKSGSSVNYLTKEVIYWGRTTRSGHSEKKLAFKLKAPLKFSEFNLDTCLLHGFCMQAPMPAPAR